MLPQPYTFSHGDCLNNFLQVWVIGTQIDPVHPFRYINQDDGVSHFIEELNASEYELFN